jgi:cell division septal protein FtsQ
MWRKRKTRNRRVAQEQALEVKAHSRKLRLLRLRLVAKLFAIAFGAVTVLFLLWRGGDWVLNQLILPNPAFAVREIDIQTDGIIPIPQLRLCTGVNVGDCLLTLDLRRIRRDLEFLPWVQSAAVERVRPHTLRIRVTEREPIAQTILYQPASSRGASRELVFYFDAEGFVILPLDAHQQHSVALGLDSLPSLTGVAGVDLRPGHRVESRQIRAALDLISTFTVSPMLGLVDLATIDLSVPHLLQLTTAQGATIKFAPDDLAKQLRRWRQVHDYSLRTGKALAFLDLSVSNNVPARWMEAEPVPAAQPKPKPSRYKKSHV